ARLKRTLFVAPFPTGCQLPMEDHRPLRQAINATGLGIGFGIHLGRVSRQASALPDIGFVNFGFHVEEVCTLQTTINQTRRAVQKSQLEQVTIKKEKNRGTWNAEEL